jgi:hypothetical protein
LIHSDRQSIKRRASLGGVTASPEYLVGSGQDDAAHRRIGLCRLGLLGLLSAVLTALGELGVPNGHQDTAATVEAATTEYFPIQV